MPAVSMFSKVLIDPNDFVNGARVRCLMPGPDLHKVGRLQEVDFNPFAPSGFSYAVKEEKTGKIIVSRWSGVGSFELIGLQLSEIETNRLVKYLVPGVNCGVIGYISSVTWMIPGLLDNYIVVLRSSWPAIVSVCPMGFEPYVQEDGPETLRSGSIPFGGAPTFIPDLPNVELAQAEKKPCPRAYYGLPNCTCGKCHIPRRNPAFLKL